MNDKTADKLRECPFCGSPGESHGVPVGGKVWWVTGCGSEMCLMYWRDISTVDDRETAEAKWNTRPTAVASNMSPEVGGKEGEAVSWQVRSMERAGGYWMGWGQVQSEEEAKLLVGLYKEVGVTSEYRALYTHPPRAMSAEDARDAIVAAIDAEPELPGKMPDEMWLAIRGDRDACMEAMRIAVRQTKSGIRARFIVAMAQRGDG